MTKVTIDDKTIDFAALVNLMDDGIREAVHRDLAPCTDQEFADVYLQRDPALRETISKGAF